MTILPSSTTSLCRSVRVCFASRDAEFAQSRDGKNGFAGFPRMTSLGSYTQFDVTVQGTPDKATGYLLDIHAIDKALHAAIIAARVQSAYANADDPIPVATRLFAALARELPIATSLRWFLTPFFSIEVCNNMNTPSQTTAQPRVIIRQRFDFAAAHRLHAANLSDEANRAAFGKCNNPSSHGHNYQFEPAVGIVPSAHATNFNLATLEVLCERVLLDKFDHTNLNIDTQEFNQSKGGVNPSVENIAAVFFRLLAPAVASQGAHLESMTVWETDRTCATVRAQ